MHRALEIRNEVLNRLNALVDSGVISSVEKNEGVTPSKHPCITLSLGSDTPDITNSRFIDSILTINTDIAIMGTDPDPDKLMLNVRTELHKSLMSSHNLGLDYVIKIQPQSQFSPENSGDGDLHASETRVSWEVTYRSSYTDPTK